VVRETSLEKPKALKNTKREKKPSKKKKEQEEALNLEQEKETLSEKDSEKDLEKKAIKDSKKSSKETRKPSEELEDTVKVVKEAQEESKKGEVQKTETKRTFRGRNLKKSPSFFSKKSKAVQGKETPLQEEDVLAKKNSSVIAFISSHLQQSVEEENLKLGKTAILLFCCCLLLSVFLIVVVGIKYYSKTPKKAITSGSELDPSKKTDLPPPSNLTSFENEPLFKEVLALIQQEKYFKARERLMQQLSEGHNSQLYEQIERLLTQVDQKILQKHHFQAPLTWDSGQVQLHYDFLNQNYQDKKDFFYQDKMQYHLNSEGFALLDGEISHNARFMETLSVSLLFKNENTTQGIFYLKGLGYQLIYPVNGQGVLLQSKKQKIPLWSGNGPPLTEGELQWIVLPEEIRLEYQQEILFRVPISETQDSGVALRFLEGDPKKAFILKNLQLQSKFAVGWVEKTIPHYGEPKD
jgi:hypothetical protein